MPRRRSELEDMLSSLVSTNDTIDNVFVGGYSLRRRKTGGGKGDDGFGSPKSSVTPAVTRTTRKSKKPQEHLVAMTEPRPSTRRHVKASKALLSPVEDLSFQRSPSLSPPPPPPLDFETDDVEDTIATRKRNRRGKERKDGLAGRGKTANQEVDGDKPSELETDSGQVEATENNHFVEEEEEMEEDKQREGESGDNEDDIESTCQEDQTSYAQKMEESDPSDHINFDSDQQVEDDDSASQVIDSDQGMDSNETDQESESVRLSKETKSDMQLKSSQKPRIASDDGGNAELKVKLMNEMHRMRKIADYGERNMERFPTEELKSVAAILKSKKKEVSVAVNDERTKRPKKSKIPATVNSRVRKGSKMKVLLAMPGRECLKSTSAESARHFMQERLYNSSQYKREPAGKRKENSESIDNTTSYCIYGRYALLRRDKVIKA